MRITFVSPNSLLTLRGSEQFVLQTSKRFARLEGVGVRAVSFHRTHTEDFSKLSAAQLESRLSTIRSYLGPDAWDEFNWLTPIVRRKSWFFDRLNRRLEFIPPTGRLLKILRESDVLYLVTWRVEDLLAFLPLAFLAGRKGTIAGIHSRILLRRSEVPLVSLWLRLGVLRGFHTVDSETTGIFDRAFHGRVTQIPNGVDCDLFAPGGKPDGEFVVLFAGAADPAKGADLLPKIHEGLMRRIPQGIAMWICTSETGKLGKEIANWSKDRQGVVFKGWVSRLELAIVLRQASVLLSPSRREIQSLSSLEAQASGTPVIATDLPTFRESVVDGATGLLVPRFTPEAFVDKIVELHSMWLAGEPYRRMCERARKNALSRFSSAGASKKLLDLLASS